MPVAPGTYEWPSVPLLITPCSFGGSSNSAALVADGRILYCFVGGPSGGIAQGYAPSEAAFFLNDSVTVVTQALASDGEQSCCVFRHPDGNVYLIGAGRSGTVVYKSPSGLGGDWVAHGTISGGIPSDRQRLAGVPGMCGEPYITGSGRWVLSCPKWYITGTLGFNGKLAYATRQSVWISDTNGLTWTETLDVGFYTLGGAYGEFQARNLTPWAGSLYWSCVGNVDAEKPYYSADSGSSWTGYSIGGAYAYRANYFLADDSFLYLTGYNSIYKTTTPTNVSSYVSVANYPTFDMRRSLMQKVGLLYGLTNSYGTYLYPPGVSGWSINRIVT